MCRLVQEQIESEARKLNYEIILGNGMPKNTTTIGFGSPSRYFQGHRLLYKLESYSKKFGEKVLAIIDPFFFQK